jgi:hypothetical protein
MVFSFSCAVSFDDLFASLSIKLNGVEVKFSQLDKQSKDYIINSMREGKLSDTVELVDENVRIKL